MKYRIETWTIRKLRNSFIQSQLNLSPSYQRNDIWTEKAQKDLVSSIRSGMPIPNFFFHEREDNKFDVADGQQRTRAILAFIKGEISDNEAKSFEDDKEFLDYKICIIIVFKSVTPEEIRAFYVKVNNTGLKINSPELTKSKYYNTKILKLVEDLAELEEVRSLDLFTEKQEDRMINREYIEELVAQILYGITDKKLAIIKLYEANTDITDSDIKSIKTRFQRVLNIFYRINKLFSIASTRYSQKNDFYTLFGIFNDHLLKQKTYAEIFDFLVKIQDDISPSNESCPILQEYAFSCVTQSNGKAARERRYKIVRDLAFNSDNKLTNEQKQLIKYYGLKKTDYTTVEEMILLDSSKIKTQYSE